MTNGAPNRTWSCPRPARSGTTRRPEAGRPNRAAPGFAGNRFAVPESVEPARQSPGAFPRCPSIWCRSCSSRSIGPGTGSGWVTVGTGYYHRHYLGGVSGNRCFALPLRSPSRPDAPVALSWRVSRLVLLRRCPPCSSVSPAQVCRCPIRVAWPRLRSASAPREACPDDHPRRRPHRAFAGASSFRFAPHRAPLLLLTGLTRFRWRCGENGKLHCLSGILRYRHGRHEGVDRRPPRAHGRWCARQRRTIPPHERSRLRLHHRRRRLGRLRAGEPAHRTVGVCQMRPESVGSIHARSADPHAPPAIRPNILSAEEDRISLLAGRRIIRRLMEHPRMDAWRSHELRPGPGRSTDEELLDYCRETGQPPTTRSAPARWATIRWRWSTTGCASSTPPSCPP